MGHSESQGLKEKDTESRPMSLSLSLSSLWRRAAQVKFAKMVMYLSHPVRMTYDNHQGAEFLNELNFR